MRGEGGAAVQAGGRHDAGVRLGLRGPVRRGVRVEPVAQLPGLVPEARRRQLRLHVLQVPDHRRVVGSEPVEVAVRLPQGLRHPHGGVVPDGQGTGVVPEDVDLGVLEDVRDRDRHDALRVVGLLLGEVEEPAVQEVGGVELERGRGRVGRDVPGPAEPLVALRAVRRHREEVALLAPHRVLDEPVDERFGAGEGAGAAQIRVDDDGLQGRGVELARPPGDLGVAEPVEGEGRLEDLDALTGQHERVRRGGGAQRPRAELAVLEHLRVPQHDLGARRPRDGDPHPADEVLAEVHERPARGRGRDALRAQHLLPAHRLGDLRDQPGGVELADPGGQRGARPAAEPAVDPLPLVQVVGRHLARGGGPVVARAHDLDRAVVVRELEHREQPDLLAVVRHRAVEPEVTAVPAVADARGERDEAGGDVVGRLAGLLGPADEVGDVVHLERQAPLVGGPPRREHLVADGLPAERELVHAVGGGEHAGPGDP